MAKQKKAVQVRNTTSDTHGTVGTPPFCRFAIEHYGDWTYSTLRMMNGKIHPDYSDDTDKKLIRTFTEFLGNTYMMNEMPTYQVSDENFQDVTGSPISIESYRVSVAMKLKRWMKKNGKTNFSCHIVGSRDSFIMIAYLEHNVITVVSAMFDSVYMICKCCYDAESDVSGRMQFERVYNSPFYISRKTRVADVLLQKHTEIHNTDISTLRLIEECVRCASNETPEELLNHTPCEMYSMRKVIKSLSLPYWPIDIKNWITAEEGFYENKNFSKATLDVVNIISNQRSDQHPLIDLGEKEFKFIMKYAADNGFLGRETVDLYPYVSNISYGDTYRYNIEHNGSTGEIISTFILDEDTSDFRMILMYNIPDNDLTIFSTIDYVNIRKFNHITSCHGYNTSLLCRNAEKLPSSMEAIDDGISKIFLDANLISSIVSSFISLYVVLHDRPSRSRMVNCTHRIPKEHKGKKKSKPKEEYDFVVTRILKTTQAAKKYVSEMNSSGQIDREYTLESWPRRGYYRKVRGGGAVWISPTVCHRRLALSEKELHIKL